MAVRAFYRSKLRVLICWLAIADIFLIGCSAKTFEPKAPITSAASEENLSVTIAIEKVEEEISKGKLPDSPEPPKKDDKKPKEKPTPLDTFSMFLAAFKRTYKISYGEWETQQKAELAKYKANLDGQNSPPGVPPFSELSARLDEISNGAFTSNQKKAASLAAQALADYKKDLDGYVASVKQMHDKVKSLDLLFSDIVKSVAEVRSAKEIDVKVLLAEDGKLGKAMQAFSDKRKSIEADRVDLEKKTTDCAAKYLKLKELLAALRQIVNVPIPNPDKENDDFWKKMAPWIAIPGLGLLVYLGCLIFGHSGDGKGKGGGESNSPDGKDPKSDKEGTEGGDKVKGTDKKETVKGKTIENIKLPSAGPHFVRPFIDTNNDSWIQVFVEKDKRNLLELPFSLEKYDDFKELIPALKQDKKFEIVSLNVTSWYPVSMEVRIAGDPADKSYIVYWASEDLIQSTEKKFSIGAIPTLLKRGTGGSAPEVKLKEGEIPLPTAVLIENKNGWSVQLVQLPNKPLKAYRLEKDGTSHDLIFDPSKVCIAKDNEEHLTQLISFDLSKDGYPLTLTLKRVHQDGRNNDILELRWNDPEQIEPVIISGRGCE